MGQSKELGGKALDEYRIPISRTYNRKRLAVTSAEDVEEVAVDADRHELIEGVINRGRCVFAIGQIQYRHLSWMFVVYRELGIPWHFPCNFW